MKFKLIVFVASLGLMFSACKSNKNQNNNQEAPSKEEEYINPFEPEKTDPDDQGGGGSPDPVDPVIPEPVYDESADFVDGIDINDFSSLYSSINSIENNYTSTINGFFNEVGGYDYYRHYQKNYVCDKTGYYTDEAQYILPDLDAYLPICNSGFINKNNNYYNFALAGSTKEQRMAYSLTESDLTNEVTGKKYQDDLFTVGDLNQAYFEEKGFTRISENKYQCTEISACEQFLSICCPNLINTGYYLTFSRVTIETNPLTDVALRVRLYVASTQVGKLIDSHTDQANKPNWYLLFSEALISNVGTTTFAPADSLLS